MESQELLKNFRATLKALEDSLKDAPQEHVVEVGTTIAAMINSASDILEEVKTNLREDALSELKHEPGSITFNGKDIGEVTVTVPSPRLQLLKDVDPEVLKTVLGDDFDLYFDTKVRYVPRKTAGPLVMKLASGREKTVLLSSLEEREGTPRVSFKKR